MVVSWRPVIKSFVLTIAAIDEAAAIRTTHGFGRWSRAKPCGVTHGATSAITIEMVTTFFILSLVVTASSENRVSAMISDRMQNEVVVAGSCPTRRQAHFAERSEKIHSKINALHMG